MRTQKETSQIIEKTITEIIRNDNVNDDLISLVCQKNKISEKCIRRIANNFRDKKYKYV
jgi:ribosomal protein L17